MGLAGAGVGVEVDQFVRRRRDHLSGHGLIAGAFHDQAGPARRGLGIGDWRVVGNIRVGGRLVDLVGAIETDLETVHRLAIALLERMRVAAVVVAPGLVPHVLGVGEIHALVGQALQRVGALRFRDAAPARVQMRRGDLGRTRRHQAVGLEDQATDRGVGVFLRQQDQHHRQRRALYRRLGQAPVVDEGLRDLAGHRQVVRGGVGDHGAVLGAVCVIVHDEGTRGAAAARIARKRKLRANIADTGRPALDDGGQRP